MNYDKLAAADAKALTVDNVMYRRSFLEKTNKHLIKQAAVSVQAENNIIAHDRDVDKLIQHHYIDKVVPRYKQALQSQKAAMQAVEDEKVKQQKQFNDAATIADAAATEAEKKEALVITKDRPLISRRAARNGLSELLGAKSKDADADSFIDSLRNP